MCDRIPTLSQGSLSGLILLVADLLHPVDALSSRASAITMWAIAVGGNPFQDSNVRFDPLVFE